MTCTSQGLIKFSPVLATLTSFKPGLKKRFIYASLLGTNTNYLDFLGCQIEPKRHRDARTVGSTAKKLSPFVPKTHIMP